MIHKAYIFAKLKMSIFMKDQNTKLHQTKIIHLHPVPKKSVSIPLHIHKIAIIILFGFFISLSLASNQIFLEEILISTTVICLVLVSKES